jgi:hypothetical protein
MSSKLRDPLVIPNEVASASSYLNHNYYMYVWLRKVLTIINEQKLLFEIIIIITNLRLNWNDECNTE